MVPFGAEGSPRKRLDGLKAESLGFKMPFQKCLLIISHKVSWVIFLSLIRRGPSILLNMYY